ncbi:hypothetical protein AAU61_20665 [Desulfocarbo indianensis]|nr:hypothetical protein AAU61_20665 [Desulfocarbo indianensis]
MEWSLTKIAAGLAGASVLFVVYLYLAALHRQRFLFLWTLAWSAYLARYLIFPWMPHSHGLSLLPVVYATLALAGSYLLLCGARDFLGRPLPWRWLWFLLATYAWTFISALARLPFELCTLPCAWTLAFTYALSGWELWRAERLEKAGRWLAAAGLGLWSLAQVTYPFIINRPLYSQYGYIISTGLEVWTAIGLLIVFFQHSRRELLEAQAVLTGSEERLRLAMHNMPLLLYAFDEKGRLVVWNRECARVTGFAAREMLGGDDAVKKLFPQAEARAAALAAWDAPDADFRQRELETTCADGSRKLIAWSNISKAVPIPGWAAWGVGVDLSERKRARQALEQLAAGVAHNFNNVLMAVMGNLQATGPLLAQSGEKGRQAAELVANALKSAAAGREVGARLSAYVGGGAGRQGDLTPLELSPVVQAALDLARTGWSHLGLARVEFRVRLKPGTRVYARRGELMEVFLNLIKNALEAMPQGGVLTMTQEEREQDVLITFSDTGPGMDMQTRQRAFDPFFSTKGAAVRGLGLSSSLGILHSLGGDLQVDDKPGPGATFLVRLRRAEEAEPQAQARLPLAAAGRGGGRVLLVEDEALVALGLQAMLAQEGYSVRWADSLREARLALGRETPEVLLCDMMLPDGAGWELAADLSLDREGRPLTSLVVLTGWSADCGGQGGAELESLAEAVLHKPVEREPLLKAIAQAMASAAARQALPKTGSGS